MRLWSRFAILLAFVPLVASAQYKDLDTALSNLNRGFGSGDPSSVVSGIADGDKVKLVFPGLIDQTGSNSFYGREQASYLLDSLFGKVHPSGFEQVSARKESAAGQYHITGNWAIQNGGKAESRELYLTLQQNKNGTWSIVSAQSGK